MSKVDAVDNLTDTEAESKLHSSQNSSALNEKVWVAVRIRPLQKTEIDVQEKIAWQASGAGTLICLPDLEKGQNAQAQYSYNRVFDQQTTNEEVYRSYFNQLFLSSLDGYNSTVFAYGQTGAGKTTTMRAIMYAASKNIFEQINTTKGREFHIRVSALEVYNENVKDLLNENSMSSLKVLEDFERGVFVEDLTDKPVNSSEQLDKFLNEVEQRRHVRDTKMNKSSSRSHQLVRIYVESRPIQDADLLEDDATLQTRCTDEDVSSPSVTAATINFVDLAGSERTSQAASEDTEKERLRLKEAGSINKSLLTLGEVIRALGECSANGRRYVPYRNSKLTRILQPSLSGNSRMAIICAISPALSSVENTRGALHFANNAKKVVMRPQVNEVADDKTVIKHMEAEIKALKNMLTQQQLQQVESAARLGAKQLKEELDLAASERDEAMRKLKHLEKYILIGGADPSTVQGRHSFDGSEASYYHHPGRASPLRHTHSFHHTSSGSSTVGAAALLSGASKGLPLRASWNPATVSAVAAMSPALISERMTAMTAAATAASALRTGSKTSGGQLFRDTGRNESSQAGGIASPSGGFSTPPRRPPAISQPQNKLFLNLIPAKGVRFQMDSSPPSAGQQSSGLPGTGSPWMSASGVFGSLLRGTESLRTSVEAGSMTEIGSPRSVGRTTSGPRDNESTESSAGWQRELDHGITTREQEVKQLIDKTMNQVPKGADERQALASLQAEVLIIAHGSGSAPTTPLENIRLLEQELHRMTLQISQHRRHQQQSKAEGATHPWSESEDGVKPPGSATPNKDHEASSPIVSQTAMLTVLGEDDERQESAFPEGAQLGLEALQQMADAVRAELTSLRAARAADESTAEALKSLKDKVAAPPDDNELRERAVRDDVPGAMLDRLSCALMTDMEGKSLLYGANDDEDTFSEEVTSKPSMSPFAVSPPVGIAARQSGARSGTTSLRSSEEFLPLSPRMSSSLRRSTGSGATLQSIVERGSNSSPQGLAGASNATVPSLSPLSTSREGLGTESACLSAASGSPGMLFRGAAGRPTTRLQRHTNPSPRFLASGSTTAAGTPREKPSPVKPAASHNRANPASAAEGSLSRVSTSMPTEKESSSVSLSVAVAAAQSSSSSGCPPGEPVTPRGKSRMFVATTPPPSAVTGAASATAAPSSGGSGGGSRCTSSRMESERILRSALLTQKDTVVEWYKEELKRVQVLFHEAAATDIAALQEAMARRDAAWEDQTRRLEMQKKLLVYQVLKLEYSLEERDAQAQDTARELSASHVSLALMKAELQKAGQETQRLRRQLQLQQQQLKAAQEDAAAAAEGNLSPLNGSPSHHSFYDNDTSWDQRPSSESLLLRITDLWDHLFTPLRYRSQFLHAFRYKGVGYLEMELTRLEMRSTQLKSVADDNGPAAASRVKATERAKKALAIERRLLAQALTIAFTEEERAQMYREWGVDPLGVSRKMSLVEKIWHPATLAKPNGMEASMELVLMLIPNDDLSQFMSMVCGNAAESNAQPTAIGAVFSGVARMVTAGKKAPSSSGHRLSGSGGGVRSQGGARTSFLTNLGSKFHNMMGRTATGVQANGSSKAGAPPRHLFADHVSAPISNGGGHISPLHGGLARPSNAPSEQTSGHNTPDKLVPAGIGIRV